MTDPFAGDHYEALQVSPHADDDTIQRVFRHLAKRYHPDNSESGNPERFRELVEAFEVLTDPEMRARYDVKYAERTQRTWRVFDQESALNDVETDRHIRASLLAILYTARRADSEKSRPGRGRPRAHAGLPRDPHAVPHLVSEGERADQADGQRHAGDHGHRRRRRAQRRRTRRRDLPLLDSGDKPGEEKEKGEKEEDAA